MMTIILIVANVVLVALYLRELVRPVRTYNDGASSAPLERRRGAVKRRKRKEDP